MNKKKIISPKQSLELRSNTPLENQLLPKKCIILAGTLYKYIKNNPNIENLPHPAFGNIAHVKNSEVVIFPGRVGAPLFAISLEELITLGVEEFIYIGYAGALNSELKIGDILIQTGAVNETGIGFIYGYNFDSIIDTEKSLNTTIEKALGRDIKYFEGLVWSTDAVYCETREKFIKYLEMGVMGVEMETAALYAICRSYEKSCSAVHFITDELYNDQWKADFNHFLLDISKSKTIDLIIDEFCRTP